MTNTSFRPVPYLWVLPVILAVAPAVASAQALRADGENDYAAQVWPSETVERAPAVEAEQARRMEASWSRTVRQDLQDALMWSGDYQSSIDGEFGPGTRVAIQSYQAKVGEPITGYLTLSQIDALKQSRQRLVEALDFRLVQDYQSGITIGFPTKLFDINSYEPTNTPFLKVMPSGAPATSGSVMLISHQLRADSIAYFAEIVDGLDFFPESAYRVVRQEWFVVSGEKNGIGTYAYARAFGAEVKGFILMWPETEDAIYEPLAVAMYNSLGSISGITFETFSDSSGDLQSGSPGDRTYARIEKLSPSGN